MLKKTILDKEKAIKNRDEYFRLFEHCEIKKRVFVWHYTSFEKFYSVLEGNSLWASNTRFCNDYSEEKLIGEKWLRENKYMDDNYVICFCNEEDRLSQWRGYCPTGGVSIQFDISEITEFSLLHSSEKEIIEHEIYYNAPLPVLYTKEYDAPPPDSNQKSSIKEVLEKALISNNIDLENINEVNKIKKFIVPYIKHGTFLEENEQRLVFVNNDNLLSKCIRYRNTAKGIKAPYIVVKFGDVSKFQHKIKFPKYKYNLYYLKSVYEKEYWPHILIPICKNQDEYYNQLHPIVKQYNDGKDEYKKIKIFFDGYLPIRVIKVSPMPDQQRIVEQIRHYCKSKTWLRDVVVSESSIPYVPSAYV